MTGPVKIKYIFHVEYLYDGSIDRNKMIDMIRDRLDRSMYHLAENGMFTGDTDLEVENWDTRFEVVQ
jgi:hypothetical protein